MKVKKLEAPDHGGGLRVIPGIEVKVNESHSDQEMSDIPQQMPWVNPNEAHAVNRSGATPRDAPGIKMTDTERAPDAPTETVAGHSMPRASERPANEPTSTRVAEENYHRSKTPNHVPDTAPGIQMTRADDSSDTRVPEDRPGAFRIPGYRGSRPSREEEEVKDEELGGRADEAYATILPFSPVSARVVDESEEARLREMEERLRAIEAGRQSPEALNPMEDGRQRPEAPRPYSHDGIKAAQAHPKDDTSSQRWCDSARSKKGLAVGAILALIATLAVIIVVVVLVVGKTPTDTPINTPTNAPSSLMGMIAAASPDQGDALQDPSTPQYKAFAWLEDNPNLGTYSDQQILRRYALAVLFYSTGGDTWDKNDGWLSNLNECDWYQSGALDVCKDGALKELNLTNNALQGTIPPEISLLSDSLGKCLLGIVAVKSHSHLS